MYKVSAGGDFFPFRIRANFTLNLLKGEFMTKNSFFARLKTFFLVFLAVISVTCFTAFLVGCGSTESSESDPTYSYTETDTDVISNASFVYGTYNKADSDYPIASPTGWTKAVDSSAASSNVDSGVISTESAAWTALFDKLYSDSDFAKFLKVNYEEDAIASVRAEKEDEEYQVTEDEKKAYYKTVFVNPGTDESTSDSFVYMLNNYVTNGRGTAQRIRSSSSVSVKKGEIYEISVLVKTAISHGEGANIRLVNSVNGNSQAEFRINGIKTAEWKKYTFYFVADGDYDCSFTVTLGLGYGKGDSLQTDDYVEGTVFFDEVSVTKADALPEGDLPSFFMSFGGSDPVVCDADEEFPVYYAVIDDAFYYNNYAEFDFDGDLTYSNVKIDDEYITSLSLTGQNLAESVTFTETEGNVTVDLNKAAYTVRISSDDFTVATGDYVLVTFKILNKLNELNSTDVSVDVWDVYGGNMEKRAGVASFSTVSEDAQTCNLIVKNNFKEGENRRFFIDVVIGPADVASVNYGYQFATGKVVISDFKLATGSVDADDYDKDQEDSDQADFYGRYDMYSFYTSNSSATVALYAGYSADYSEHNHSESYSLNPTKGVIGEIVTQPTSVDGYTGIVANHNYIVAEGEDLETAVNDRLDFNGEKGYAGLINSKYHENYDNEELDQILSGLYDSEKDIQPIVIYNKDLDHYGFIGASKTISASSYASVTVKLKAFGDAVAYAYLVDVSGESKDVMSFAAFTVNTDKGNTLAKGTAFKKTDFAFVLTATADSETDADGWTTLTFYLATGANSENFRVEVWNGGRDNSENTQSRGYVLINSITVSLSSAFSEPASWQTAFSASGNPLFTAGRTSFKDGDLIAYVRELTETEKDFNKEYPSDAVSYEPTYIWAQNDNLIYAVKNTVDPVESDPYANIKEEETNSGCTATSDPSTFWLSFSSIVLAVVLIAAVIALFIKTRARRKTTRGEVKAQYKVRSRSEIQKEINKSKKAKQQPEQVEETPVDDNAEEPVTDGADAVETPDDGTEITVDENAYTYGEVQDFGDVEIDIPDDKKEDDNSDKTE